MLGALPVCSDSTDNLPVELVVYDGSQVVSRMTQTSDKHGIVEFKFSPAPHYNLQYDF